MTEQERDQILVKLLEIVSGHEKKLSSIQENVSSLKESFSSLEKRVDRISGSIAVIEFEHGGNIQLLLDGQVSILEKLKSFEERFESDEKELVNHSNRIWNLENHIGIA